MQQINEDGLYRKTVSSVLAALARNNPDNGQAISQAHQDLLGTPIDAIAPRRMIAAMSPGQGTGSIMKQAIEDVADKLGMRSITTTRQLDSIDAWRIDPKQDIVLLTQTIEEHTRAGVGNLQDALDQLNNNQLAKASQAALLMVDLDYSVSGLQHDDTGPLAAAVTDAAAKMLAMQSNQVYMARISSTLPAEQMRQAVAAVSTQLHLEGQVDIFGYQYSPEGFVRSMEKKHQFLKDDGVGRLIAEIIRNEPNMLASTDGKQITLQAGPTPSSWGLFFHEMAHLVHQNGGQMPTVREVEVLAGASLGAEVATKLGDAMRQDIASRAAGNPSFFKALESYRDSGDPAAASEKMAP